VLQGVTEQHARHQGIYYSISDADQLMHDMIALSVERVKCGVSCRLAADGRPPWTRTCAASRNLTLVRTVNALQVERRRSHVVCTFRGIYIWTGRHCTDGCLPRHTDRAYSPFGFMHDVSKIDLK
jgi:hypothetical protein